MTNEGKALKESYQWQIKSQWKKDCYQDKVMLSLSLFFKDERKRDVDNYTKLVIDSLKGICFEDDSQVYDLNITKAVDSSEPRIMVEVSKLCQK